ncbi:MAG: hypothetical protein AB7J19_02275, partial [Beijerinckiaceae bacterium]
MRSRYTFAAAIVAVCALLAAAVLYLAQPGETTRRPVETYVGDVRLVVPAAYFRFEYAKVGGRMQEIDLAADAQTFRPARLQRNFNPTGPDPLSNTIFLTIQQPEGRFDPAERTTRLFTRFLQPDTWSHPGGLVMRRFQNGSPYENEDLYMAPPEGRRFAARCPRPRQPPSPLPATCIAEVRMDGVEVRMRFSADLLADWDRLL